MNIFQFDKNYFDDCFDYDNDKNNTLALGKLSFWTWMLEEQAKKGFHLLPPFINYICNTNEEMPVVLTFNEDTDDDDDGIIN